MVEGVCPYSTPISSIPPAPQAGTHHFLLWHYFLLWLFLWDNSAHFLEQWLDPHGRSKGRMNIVSLSPIRLAVSLPHFADEQVEVWRRGSRVGRDLPLEPTQHSSLSG